MRILAIDPGGTTGWALAKIPEKEPGVKITTGKFRTGTGLDDLIQHGDTVIVEEPVRRVEGMGDTVVFEVYGAVRERVQSKGAHLIGQHAYIPHFLVKRYKLTPRQMGGVIHERDAWLHLFYFLRTTYDLQTALENTTWGTN